MVTTTATKTALAIASPRVMGLRGLPTMAKRTIEASTYQPASRYNATATALSVGGQAGAARLRFVVAFGFASWPASQRFGRRGRVALRRAVTASASRPADRSRRRLIARL